MNLRLDQVLLDIFARAGVEWLLLSLVVLGVVSFGSIVRSLLTAMLVLVCTQVWWAPLHFFAFSLRWWLLIVLCFRGFMLMAAAPPVPGESRVVRRLVIALGLMALFSIGWSENPEYAFELSASFCLGLCVTFGLLWRVLDRQEVIPALSRGAMWFGLLAFGLGFLVPAIAYLSSAWMFVDVVQLGEGERFRGLFTNANGAGLLAAMVLPIITAAPREFLGRVASLRLLVFVLTASTVFLSGSRSSLIGSLVALALLLLYRYGAGAFMTLALGGVGVFAFVSYASLDDIDSSAVGHIVRTKHLSTLSGRLELWEQGWEVAQGHLVFGQGWGKSRSLNGVDLEQAIESGSVVGASNLHNAHLQLLIDTGFIGVGIFWAFCGCVLGSGMAILRAPRTPRNAFGLVIFASSLILLGDTFVHGAIWSMGSPTTLVFWGLCVASLKEGDRVRREFGAGAQAPRAWAMPALPAAA